MTGGFTIKIHAKEDSRRNGLRKKTGKEKNIYEDV